MLHVQAWILRQHVYVWWQDEITVMHGFCYVCFRWCHGSNVHYFHVVKVEGLASCFFSLATHSRPTNDFTRQLKETMVDLNGRPRWASSFKLRGLGSVAARFGLTSAHAIFLPPTTHRFTTNLQVFPPPASRASVSLLSTTIRAYHLKSSLN